MREDLAGAIKAWLGVTRGSDDGAALAIWALQLRAAERAQKAVRR
jgi:hypothetical protein